MEMWSSRSAKLAFLVVVSAVVGLISPAVGTDHIVGANKGWNPGINYTLWANNQTFFLGDLISFRYQKTQYNVFEVNKTGYDNCTTEGAVGNWSGGKDFIPLNRTGRFYFICGNGQCFNGMKVSIVVHPLPPSPSPAVAAANQTSSAAPWRNRPARSFKSLALALASAWLGYGWV